MNAATVCEYEVASWHSCVTAMIWKKTLTIICCWEKTGQDGQESTRNHQKQVCNELEAAGRQLSVSTVR